MHRRLVTFSEEAGCFNDDIDFTLTPWDVGWVAFAEHGNGFTVNHQLPFTGGDIGVEFTEQRVVFSRCASVLLSVKSLIATI